jgi:hypothetical protein
MKELFSASVYSGNFYRKYRKESHFESAFDKFELRQCISDNIIWYIPKELTKFLTQTKTSRFIECYKKLDKYSKETVFHSGSDHRKFIHSKEELELTKVIKINQICQKSELSVFIHSSPTSSGRYFEKRQATRQTWGSHAIKSIVNVFFVIAEPKDEKTQKELESEAFINKDIIQFGFQDSYYNVTLKHFALLRWAHENCLHSKYILKTDDDIIVNIEHLLKNLHTLKKGITGCMFRGMPALRDIKNPWFMPECIHPDPVYPYYMSGPGYVMTKDIIKPLLDTLEEYSGPVFDIDDAFITGVLAEKAGVRRHDHKKFKFTDQCEKRTDVCFMFDVFVMINCGTGNDMIEFWKKWKQTKPESCSK